MSVAAERTPGSPVPIVVPAILVILPMIAVLHHGFVFGRLRRTRAFACAAAVSAAVFGAQHLYLILTMGWMVGGASVLLAVLLAFPLAFAFERGGNSIGAPAVLHTSSNAPVMVFSLPPDILAMGLLPHMAVVLASLYGLFALRGRQ